MSCFFAICLQKNNANSMIGVITADIERSRKVETDKWLPILKEFLQTIGSHPKDWEIYRGDSFQLEIPDPLKTLHHAILIKATMRQIKPLDVRISIGIGEKGHQGERITESNGTAFIRSGEQFEKLKEEKAKLAIKTPWKSFDQEMNILFNLSSIAMDNWTMGSAQIVKTMLTNEELPQQEIGKILNIKQNAVSGRIKRAHYNEIIAFEELFQQKLKLQLSA